MAGADNREFEFRGFRVDTARRRALGPDGEALKLRPREFDTLVVLLRSAGEVVSKDELLAAVWPDTVVEENNLNQAISRLRQVLGDDRKDPRFIATITGRGYQFVAPVQDTTGEAAESTGPTAAADTSGRSRGRTLVIVFAFVVLIIIVALVASFLERRDLSPPLSLDGAERVSITPASNASPSLSPDGTMMAFVSDRSGMPQIWVQGTAGGEAVQLTDGDRPARSPSWSPTSDRILFEMASAGGTPTVWLVDALGSRPPRLLAEDARAPRFAPGGRSFVFARGQKGIHIGDLGDGSTRALDGLPATTGFAQPMPAMNAAGDIAFVLADEGPSGNLWLYEAATGEFRPLTRSEGALSGVWAEHPVWLPDGRTLVYVAAPDDPFNTHLWSMDVASGRSTQLSTGVGGYGAPTVSRDGEVFAYTHSRPVWRLVSTDPEAGTHDVILETREAIALPIISPEGRDVVYFGDQLYTLPVSGGQPRIWSGDTRHAATLPTWSRSEPVIWYYRDRDLHRLDTRTGNDERVLEDFHWSRYNWLAVHDDRLAYRARSRIPGRGSSVVHDLSTDETRTLDIDILPADFTRDGQYLLARKIPGADIVICDTVDFDCQPIVHDGKNVDGAVPRWSHDEQRVFFRRARPDKPGYAWLWVVDRDGSTLQQMVEVGPYDSSNFYFAVTHDDHLIWPQRTHAGNPEIWQVRNALDPTDR